MSEELIQRNLVEAPEKMGAWNFYNIGATTLKALKAAKIIPDRNYEEFETKKPDALLVKKSQVVAAIEYKQPKELRTQKQIEAAIFQEIGTAQALGAKVYIVTDGKKTFWLNPFTGNEIKLENGSRITLNFNKNDVECIKLINKIIASVNDNNDILIASVIVDPLPLAQKVWQDLWAVSGATPENCLYTFVEIFIFKYLSDLGVLTGLHSFSTLRKQYNTNTESEVLEYYADTVRKKIKELFPWNPKDKTTIINGTIFVSKDEKAVSGYATVFKKILERFDSFGTLENIDYDFKSKLFETFLKESISKKNWGQFFTPLKVVRAIVSMADISEGMNICDPFCGVGKFLLEPILHDIHRYFRVENGKLKPQITLSGFDKGFDKDEQKTIILAKANMLIYMSSLIREHSDITKDFAELFNKTFLLQTNSILGTLANPVVDEYDLILTNPPYVMSGSSNLKDEIAKQAELKQHFAISAMGVEGLSMEWIVRSLKPGGKAFIVVPDGVMNRSNDKRLREFILDECNLDAVISLPLNTFFTTNKKTYIMVLTKKIAVNLDGVITKKRQMSPVFTYLCSEIGETRDTYRFDIKKNDLDNATTLYNMFKGVPDRFTAEDKRCKIASIDDFYNGVHWSIERWWTREEKIALGIEDENETISIEDFIAKINDVSSSLTEFEEPLRELIKKKAELNFKEILLSEIFDFSQTTNNSNFTKTFIQKHQGNIPVYGASKDKNDVGYGYIEDNVQGVKYFSDCLTWNIDGSLGLFLRHGKFSLSEKVIPLIVQELYKAVLSLDFIKYAIMSEVQEDPFSFTNKGGKSRLGNIKINIPINNKGVFDLVNQRYIASQWTIIDELKNEIRQKYQEISALSIIIAPYKGKMKILKLTDLFEIVRGNGKYTKSYTQQHVGNYPLYSGNTTKEFAWIDSYDYNIPCISWTIDGLAGYIMCHKEPFSATNHRGILIPKLDGIDINYAKYILEPKFRDMKKGRLGDKGQNEYTSLPPFMLKELKLELPVTNDGNLDLSVQQEISQNYMVIEQYKKEVLEKVDALLTQKFSY